MGYTKNRQFAYAAAVSYYMGVSLMKTKGLQKYGLNYKGRMCVSRSYVRRFIGREEYIVKLFRDL